MSSMRVEFLRYKHLGERAIQQLTDADLSRQPLGTGNSVATLCRHMSGNFRSRFTDFLTTDGEKPWRRREEEFDPCSPTRPALLSDWEAGWASLLSALDALTDEHLGRTVTIRAQSLLVHEALHRSLAHASYHVGQIVYLAKAIRGDKWMSLSIPRGRSDDYNRHPTLERGAASGRESS